MTMMQHKKTKIKRNKNGKATNSGKYKNNRHEKMMIKDDSEVSSEDEDEESSEAEFQSAEEDNTQDQDEEAAAYEESLDSNGHDDTNTERANNTTQNGTTPMDIDSLGFTEVKFKRGRPSKPRQSETHTRKIDTKKNHTHDAHLSRYHHLLQNNDSEDEEIKILEGIIGIKSPKQTELNTRSSKQQDIPAVQNKTNDNDEEINSRANKTRPRALSSTPPQRDAKIRRAETPTSELNKVRKNLQHQMDSHNPQKGNTTQKVDTDDTNSQQNGSKTPATSAQSNDPAKTEGAVS